ncbi:outer membrane beta-barrel protein [Pedobacter sp. KR3-3]|uniref:Outer membrane beta-barrel protein n=1 Tax=Pedobacter albus TaxID=3113905 RepID=A0ABU7IC43_9SPHI|nr:outer membrane beta-barrel protein [Pedobacter sp. KR3-3]MEE1947055.1 outer membrane beta-barrel protein [Pedobacter sp. KR3-3]
MKKLFLIATLLAGASLSTFAQEGRGFYLKPTGSYFLKVTPVEFPNVGSLQPRDYVFSINPSSGAQTRISESAITGSFGQGWRAGLTGGFRFNNVVAVELGVNYFQSEKNTMAKQTGYIGNNRVLALEAVGQVSALDLTPSLVFHLPTQMKFKPYLKLGAVVPVYGYLDINTTVSDQTGTIAKTVNPNFVAVELTRSERVKPKPTLGFIGAAGFNYPIGKNISFFSEIEYRNVSVNSDSKEVKSFNAIGTLANGTKVNVGLNDLPTAVKETNYHKTLTPSSNVAGTANYNPNQPSDDLKSYINIGGLGLNVGLKIGI